MVSVDGVAVANKVLELFDQDDYEGVLNLAAQSAEAKVSKKSNPAAIRKLYLKLSLVIHPDKLGKAYPNATKAFQALVKSFELLSAPEVIEEVKQKKGEKTQALARSNENCYRTRICCPRCKQPWNEGTLDGNPDYFYNFLMTGLKQYMCSTCLCEFGCMTAIHKCPHCSRPFQYSFTDYHNKIKCGNARCEKEFGFYMYHVSDRVIKDLKQQVKEEQERRMKATEAKMRRAARSQRGTLNQNELESSFLLGLQDICPRCGEDFIEIEDEEDKIKHLMECTDETKHKEFKKKKAEEQQKKETKQKLQQVQDDIQTLASWQFLGSNSEQLYLLNEEQLRIQAKQANIDSTGDKDELISRIVKNKQSNDSDVEIVSPVTNNKKLMIKDKAIEPANSQALVVGKRKSKEKNKAIPSNFHSMSVAQLKSICASHGLLDQIPKKATKLDILDIIENELLET